MSAHSPTDTPLPKSDAIRVFLVLALAYYLSSLMRGVTGTLAPVLTDEFAMSSGQLGLLAGGYFLGFAAMQLPLGRWLDRHGPKRVLLTLLIAAVISALAFSLANGFAVLVLARVLGGIGVCACLMAPLVGYRRWLAPELQQRGNSWMLMAGSLGLLSSTLPVQWLLPLMGWRGVFVALAGLFLFAMLGIAWKVPGPTRRAATEVPESTDTLWQSYRPVMANAFFRRCIPLGLVNFGALMAVQTLWAGPWLTQVAAYTPQQAAQGLFGINLSMLCTYWLWGLLTPRLALAGWDAQRLLIWGGPLGAAMLACVAWLGPAAGWSMLAGFCVVSSVLSLAQPAVGMAFPLHLTGRALSAYNLTMFLGTFVLQWIMGLGIDALQKAGLDRVSAFQWVFGLLALSCALSFAYFWAGRRAIAAELAGC